MSDRNAETPDKVIDAKLRAMAEAMATPQLRMLFDRIDAVAWQSQGFPGGDGPHVSIEGVYQGHEVFIQVLAYASEDEEPDMKLDTTRPGKDAEKDE